MDGGALAYFSGWASILSLVLTFLNTYLILRVKAGIVVKLTLEPMLAKLAENSEIMNRHLSYYDVGPQQFLETASICEANLRAVRRRFGYVRAWFLRDFFHSMRSFKRDRSRRNAQEVYTSLQQVRQHLMNMLEEKRITG